MAVVGMLMHTGGGAFGPNAVGFCLSCALVAGFVGSMTLRVAWHVPDARVSGLWHGAFMVGDAALWVLAALHPSGRVLW